MAERGIIFKDDFVTAPDKSWFDMSFDFLLSGNFGELIPTTCMECMPEDKIHAKSDSFVRLAPLVSPTFGKVNMFDYHFYVRNRSIWTQWESFIADRDQRKSWQQSNPLWTPPEMPYIDIRKVLYDSLFLTSTQGNLNVQRDAALGDYYPFMIVGYDSSVMYLVINIYYDGSEWTFKTGIMNGISGYAHHSPGAGHFESTLIVPFVYNKNDFNAYNSGSKSMFNPFSNGSLFDYLGVDISGVTSANISRFNDEMTVLNDYSTEFSDSNVPQVQFWPVTTAYDYVMPISVGFTPVEINVSEFLKSHVTFGTILVTYEASDTYKGYLFNNVGSLVAQKVSDGTQVVISNKVDPRYFQSETSKISALPLRAYHSIYIDYFRDENYISVNPCVDFSRDGDDIDYSQTKANIFDYLTLNYKAYEHDPYTSALPQAQRGEPVRFMPDASVHFDKGHDTILRRTDGTAIANSSSYATNGTGIFYTGGDRISVDNTESLLVDLSAATIENLRFANALQKLKEREARSGGRYFELMEAIFGARIDDAKIDRPIFLGGDKTPIQVSEVLQTSATEVTSDQPLGQMAGRAVAIGNDDFIEYVTPDHGFFIEICAVLPRTNYQQGLLPMFTRKVRLDYPMPQFAQLGETQVPQSELWYSADESEDKKPFGYQSRYYDSKYQRDRTSGTFKDVLSHWTWSRIFDNAPVAGKAFIEVHPDYRQFAVTDKAQEHIYIHMWHDIQVLRALPVFGTPKL